MKNYVRLLLRETVFDILIVIAVARAENMQKVSQECVQNGVPSSEQWGGLHVRCQCSFCI